MTGTRRSGRNSLRFTVSGGGLGLGFWEYYTLIIISFLFVFCWRGFWVPTMATSI